MRQRFASLGDSWVNSDVTPCMPIVTLAVDNSPARLCLLCEASSSQDILLYVLAIRGKHPQGNISRLRG